MHRLTNEWVTLGWTQLWQVTVLAAAVYVATRIFGRHRPHVGYVLWMLVIVKCLTPPIWASPVGVFSLVQSPTPVNRVGTQSTKPPTADLLPAETSSLQSLPTISRGRRLSGEMNLRWSAPRAAFDATTIEIRALGCPGWPVCSESPP